MSNLLNIYGPNLQSKDAEFHVHRVGCADCNKALYRNHKPLTLDVDDVPGSANETPEQTVVEEMYADFIEGDGDWENFLGEFKFFPCIKTS